MHLLSWRMTIKVKIMGGKESIHSDQEKILVTHEFLREIKEASSNLAGASRSAWLSIIRSLVRFFFYDHFVYMCSLASSLDTCVHVHSGFKSGYFVYICTLVSNLAHFVYIVHCGVKIWYL